MSKLSKKERDALPDSAFALPSQRKYPILDKNHARNAKARASEEYHLGNITQKEKEEIDKKADEVLASS